MASRSVTPEARAKLPLRYLPSGINTVAGAAAAAAATVAWMAAVQSVKPSGTAPKARMLNSDVAATIAAETNSSMEERVPEAEPQAAK